MRPNQTAQCGGCPNYIAISPVEGQCHGVTPTAVPVLGPPLIPGGPPRLAGVISVFPQIEAGGVACHLHPEWKHGVEMILGGDA